jgi:ethanolamine utilization microcompartment shell protein EutS
MPVPDLLALTMNERRIIAIEIDNANENLKKFVVPGLRELDTALQMWAPDAVAAIVILTLGTRRAASLQVQLPAKSAAVAVNLLPSAVGRPAVDALVKVLTHG